MDVNGATIEQIDHDERKREVRDGAGRVTLEEYDERDNPIRVTHPDEKTIARAYNRYSKKISEVNEKGIWTYWDYDETGHLIRMIEAPDTEAERIIEYTYTGNNIRSITRVADGQTLKSATAMTHDAAGNMTSLTDPEGNATIYTHNIMGYMLTRKDPRGNIWSYEYDALGRLTRMTDPLNNIASMEYDAMGNRILTVDPNGNETRLEYDLNDNLIKTVDAMGSETRFKYNNDGKLTRQIDPEGSELWHSYDSHGRLARTIDGAGNEIGIVYPDGVNSGCTSCSGGMDQPMRVDYPTFSKEFEYDRNNRLNKEIRPMGQETITVETIGEI